MTSRTFPLRRLAVAALATLTLATAHAGEDGGFSAGLQANSRTTPADVGLPVFSGAVAFTESKDDKPGASLGAWVGAFGLQIHALKYRVASSPAAVAAFYAKELARYGAVLDCRDPAARVNPPKEDERLRCDNAPKAGDFEYRVGTARNFRVVSVRQDGEATRFDMARIELRL